MKKKIHLVSTFLVFSCCCLAQVSVKNLLCEDMLNPIGLDVLQPQFSWQLISDKRNVMQTAYEIKVAENAIDVEKEKHLVWRSGKISSDQSVHVTYNGKALQSTKKYYWQVRVWDNTSGKASAWSDVNSWQMGLLNPSDWTAKWITTTLADTLVGPSPMFRKSFSLAKNIKSATVYITAHGLYEAQLNGKKIGNDYFTPGWTSYHKRLQYQAYDITGLLKRGKNTIGFILGDGWYRGYLAFNGKRNLYGNLISGLLQLEVQYTDGTKQTIQTDKSWKYTTGPILFSDLYNGEIYDARLEKAGWSTNSYNDSRWKSAAEIPSGTESLVSSVSPPARKHEEFKPIHIITTPRGETVLDFGQNLVGWVQFKVKGKAGTVIKIKHAEVLDKKGDFYTANLRRAKQQITYTLKGGGEESYEPHFTYQGFRYIKVEGYPGKLDPSKFTAIALYSDMKPTGNFTCSNTLLNQLQHNIQWGQKGNFMDVPTDCPQRDERLGWTGDAQVFSRTASFNMDVAGFFTNWMKDVRADQLPDGAVPFVIPNVLGNRAVASTGWADVATIIPWNMYLAYGDKTILEQQYASMKAWVGYMQDSSKNNLWNTGFHFGDWLFYSPDDDNDGRAAVTDKYLIAQCFYAHSTQLVINAAQVLGKTDDVVKYTALLQKIKDAFLNEYVTPNGRLVSGTQTAYTLALNFDMLPEALRTQAVQRLVQNIADYNDHLTTGFLGTPYLCEVLTRFGYTDIAYKLLLQDTYPSWLYPVKMGATTIWERWNGIKPDSTFQNAGMNSFNHYAYGAIGNWMYRVIAGLNTDKSDPGYKKIIIAPQPGGNLQFASAYLRTLYGTVSSSWKIKDSLFMLDVIIPVNTTATIKLPNAASALVKESGIEIDKVKEISAISKDGNNLNLNIGSGAYHFEYSINQ